MCIACTRHPKQRVEQELVGPSSRAQSVLLAVGVRDALFKPIAVDETPCTSWSRRSVDEMRKCGGCVEVPCWDVLERGSCIVVVRFVLHKGGKTPVTFDVDHLRTGVAVRQAWRTFSFWR